MYYLIGADGKAYGPLTPLDVHQWLAEGRANKYSRVRRAEENTWQPLGSIPELIPPPRAAANTVEAAAVERRAAAGTGRLDAGRCVTRGWALVRANPILLIGSALVAWSLIIGISFLPQVGWIAGTFVNSPLLGGLYYVYLQRIRNQPVAPEDLFIGFRIAFLPLILGGLLSSALLTVGLLPLMYRESMPMLLTAFIVPGLYLAVCYMFVLPLIVDKRMDVWAALDVSRRAVRPQWWTAFALALIVSLIAMAGLLAFLVGVVIAVPVATATLLYAYDDLFGS